MWSCQGEMLCKNKNTQSIETFAQAACKFKIQSLNYYDTQPGAFAISMTDYINMKNFFVVNNKIRLSSFAPNRKTDPVYNAVIDQRNYYDNTLIFTGVSPFNNLPNQTPKIWINFKGNSKYLDKFVFPDNCLVTICFV
jgi:hypothetical protein